MKIHLFTLVALVAGSTIQAQTISVMEVPAAVKATFETRFPAAKTACWKKETFHPHQNFEYETHNDFRAREASLEQEAYEVAFELNGKKMSALIASAGELQETETVMSAAQLPAPVRATLARDYQPYQVQEVAAVTKGDGSIVYEAGLALAGQKQAVHLTPAGLLAPR